MIWLENCFSVCFEGSKKVPEDCCTSALVRILPSVIEKGVDHGSSFLIFLAIESVFRRRSRCWWLGYWCCCGRWETCCSGAGTLEVLFAGTLERIRSFFWCWSLRFIQRGFLRGWKPIFRWRHCFWCLTWSLPSAGDILPVLQFFLSWLNVWEEINLRHFFF